VDKHVNQQVYKRLECGLNMSLIKAICGELLPENLSPKLTILNNNYIILFFRREKIVD